MKNSNALKRIKNAFFLPVITPKIERNGSDRSSLFNTNAGGSKDLDKNLANAFLPVPVSREVQDPETWRGAIREAEMPVLPFRVKMQQIYLDTAINSHVAACMLKRKNLTLLRKFALVDEKGEPNEEWTNYLKKSWFYKFVNYSLDALFYGYSLITLGDIVQNELPNLTIIRRDNISPERLEVTVIPYSPTGYYFMDSPYNESHIWIPTPTMNGTTSCGVGLFYPIALFEIYLRNMNSDNANFMQLFASPFRAAFLEATINNEAERASVEAMLRNQGAMNYGIFNKDDRLEYLTGGNGNGWKAFADADRRWQKQITKTLLGHEDSISSTPGKLGAGQGGGKDGGDHSPVQEALYEIQASDENFILPIINNELLTRLRFHGIDIPENLTFKYLNSEEEEDIIRRKNEVNLTMSEIARNLEKTNLTIDPSWFEEVTGIKLTKNETPTENNLEN
jgi:hypothetical protein